MIKLTVGELIAKLEKFPVDMQVAQSIDEEGNSFHNNIDVEESNGIVILWPAGYGLDLEEFQDYKDDEDDDDSDEELTGVPA